MFGSIWAGKLEKAKPEQIIRKLLEEPITLREVKFTLGVKVELRLKVHPNEVNRRLGYSLRGQGSTPFFILIPEGVTEEQKKELVWTAFAHAVVTLRYRAMIPTAGMYKDGFIHLGRQLRESGIISYTQLLNRFSIREQSF